MKKIEYSYRLKKLHLPTLKYRRARGDMIETYKILSEKYDVEVSPKLLLRESVNARMTSRGNKLALFQERPMKEVRCKSFTQRIVPIWNSLPNTVVLATSTNMFKERLDTHWKSQPMLHNHKAILTGVRHKGVIIPCTEA